MPAIDRVRIVRETYGAPTSPATDKWWRST